MLTEARIYATEMPGLEWLYFGQLCMGISREEMSNGCDTDVFALSEERDQCWMYLRDLFGWKSTQNGLRSRYNPELSH